jgi:hypothetical protein
LNPTTPVKDIINEVATCLVLFSHVLLESVRDVESTTTFKDSRMYVVDIMLSMFEIGVYINGQVVGDKSGMVDGRIDYDESTGDWDVRLSRHVPVKRTSIESFYETKLVGPMYAYYDLLGNESKLDHNTREFWERVILSRSGVTDSAVDFVARIKNKLV